MPSTTTSSLAPTTTTTTAPPATIEMLVLDPATTQATPYQMGPGSPVLRWTVRDARQIEVWMLSDTGSGLTRTQVLSTNATGDLQVCPGTVDASTCTAMVGTYAYEIEAIGTDGQSIFTDPADRPSFEVVATIF